MSGQEVSTHKKHQKALSYLALWQGSGHQTIPCRSAMIRKATGKDSIWKVFAQLMFMHHAPCWRCFWDLGLLATLLRYWQRFSRQPAMALGKDDYRADSRHWLESWYHSTSPLPSESGAERWHIGRNAGFMAFFHSLIFIPHSNPYHRWHDSCTRLDVLTNFRVQQGQKRKVTPEERNSSLNSDLRQRQANGQTGTDFEISFSWYIGGISVAFAILLIHALFTHHCPT